MPELIAYDTFVGFAYNKKVANEATVTSFRSVNDYRVFKHLGEISTYGNN